MDRQVAEVKVSREAMNVLNTIISYIAAHHMPPTVREIQARVGYRSTSAVKHHVKRLQEAGYLTVTPRVSRGIKLREDLMK